MTILKLILGLTIIIGFIVGVIVLLGILMWLSSVIDNKTRGTIIEKILNIVGKIIYYVFWIFIWGLFIVIIIGVAVNIGGSLIG